MLDFLRILVAAMLVMHGAAQDIAVAAHDHCRLWSMVQTTALPCFGCLTIKACRRSSP